MEIKSTVYKTYYIYICIRLSIGIVAFVFGSRARPMLVDICNTVAVFPKIFTQMKGLDKLQNVIGSVNFDPRSQYSCCCPT